MKKILLLFAIFSAIAPLFATVTISDSVPVEYRDRLERVIAEMTKGRRETEVALDDFKEDGDIVSFSLSVGEERMDTTVPAPYICKEVENMLKYSPSLFLSSPTLDYAEDGFFSTSSFPELSKGDLLWLLDRDGRKEGLFSVLGTHGGGSELEPIYLGSVLPGMRIEKAMPFTLSFLAALDIKTKAILSSISLDVHTPLYPFLPSVGFLVENNGGTVGMYGEIGVKTSFSIYSFFSDMAALKNFSIDGGAYLLLGRKEGFEISGYWNASLTYRVLPSLFISLGYARIKGYRSMISISAGGTI